MARRTPKPALFWHHKPFGSTTWRYLRLTDDPTTDLGYLHAQYPQLHPPGRFVIRTYVNGKRQYKPVEGHPHDGTPFNETQAALDDAILDARAEAKLEAKLQAALASLGVASQEPRSGKGNGSSSLQSSLDAYVDNRRDHQKLEAAQNAALVLREFTQANPSLATVKGIRKEHVTAYCNWLRAKGDQSDRTIANKYQRVRAFLRWAKHDVGLDVHERPTYTKSIPKTYTSSEIAALLAAASADEFMLVAITIMLRLGLRMQEAAHAEWSDIRGRVFVVRDKPQYGFRVKDKEQREIPIPSDVAALLSVWQSRNRPGTLILGVGKDGHPTRHLYRRFQVIARKAGVPNATQHQLRRNYITTMANSGFAMSTVQAWAGHSDLASTMRYLRPASAQEMLDKVDAVKF
ncbi:MAG: tyrosine-type recombinase/integrase [Silvibacterium sp.]|nr:tyrosine-type recombinase/integrase [Silvibacterium sp.]MBV8437539.1 tyrosine-type recombinase/integrase [Silvibacterium sp.]